MEEDLKEEEQLYIFNQVNNKTNGKIEKLRMWF